jgi:tRNA pseudouridine38-40 synthase
MQVAPRRLRLDVAYDGTDFAGWQFQPGQRTVQGVLEQVLSTLQGRGRVVVRGSGRTDAGVHAAQQVADCEIATSLDDRRIERALSRMLPVDLRPIAVATVGSEFHAQRHACSKSYRYELDRSPHGDPLRARYALHYPFTLDVATIEQALGRLPGRRDWSGFAGAGCDKADRVRELTEARLDRWSDARWTMTFSADGFLRYMVRNLVGTLLEIGTGRMPGSVIDEVLDQGRRDLAGPTADARGLCLLRVRYRGDAHDRPTPS